MDFFDLKGIEASEAGGCTRNMLRYLKDVIHKFFETLQREHKLTTSCLVGVHGENWALPFHFSQIFRSRERF